MTTNKEKQFEKLQNLWMSDGLELVESKMDKFNIFSALKLDNNEIRHSNFLAWLINPRESHGIGDYFLKEFLKNSISNFICNPRIEVRPKDILDKRFCECEIRREYRNIDILIINPDNNFVCVIENKIWSAEHSNQLENYAKYVEDEFKDYKKLHLFLAPNPDYSEPLLERKYDKKTDEKDETVEETVHYIQIGYEKIIKVIEKTLKHRGHIMPDGARVFVEHYKKMVERNIMNKIDKDVMDFCRVLYRDHKEAIDLINKCVNEVAVDISSILQKIIAENPALELDKGSHKTWTKFYPKTTNGEDAYFQFCMNNEVKFELVVIVKKETEGLLNFLIEKLELGNPASLPQNKDYYVRQISTIISKNDYHKKSCITEEELKKQLELEFKKLDIIDKLPELIKEYKSQHNNCCGVKA